MAVTNLWAVKRNVGAVIRYIENPEKTTSKEVEQVMSYIKDGSKTEEMMYVTGINCEADIAAEQFMQTKRLWGKEGGRAAYHGYQSFREGEVDAKTAHEIGVELAQRMWGDRFEVVVATHCNTGHFHNHFCVNSVSFADGYKYHDTREDIRIMRGLSDLICKEHGLSVENTRKIDQDRRRNYLEWKAEHEGEPTLRSTIRDDIDAAILYSITERDFVKVMKSMGYEFVFKSDTGKELKYPKLRLPGSDRCVRLKSLGSGYEIEDIKRRIYEGMNSTPKDYHPFSELEAVKPDETIERYRSRLERAGYRVVYRYYSIQLKSCKKRRKYREYSPELREAIRKLDKFINKQRFCSLYRIDTYEQAEELKARRKEQISELAEERKKLRLEQKRWERKGSPAYANLWRIAAQEKTDKMRELYKDVRMCDGIIADSPHVRLNAIRLVQQRTYEEQKRRLLEELKKSKKVRVRVR